MILSSFVWSIFLFFVCLCTTQDTVKMFSAQNKIKKDKNAEPTECDVQVAQVPKNDSFLHTCL